MRLKGIQVPQIILQMQEQQIISIRLSFLYSLGTDEKGKIDHAWKEYVVVWTIDKW